MGLERLKKAELAAGFAMATPDEDPVPVAKCEDAPVGQHAASAAASQPQQAAWAVPTLSAGSEWLRGMFGAKIAGA